VDAPRGGEEVIDVHMTPASYPSETPTVSTELASLRLAGLPKYAMILTLLLGVAVVADLLAGTVHGFPSWLGLIPIGTGLTGVLAYVVHDQERPHRSTGLPRYTTLAAIAGAGVLYYAVGSLAALPYVALAAGVTWFLFSGSYVTTVVAEGTRSEFNAKRATWLTGFLGLGITGLMWLAGSIEGAMVGMVATGFAVFPQMVHLSTDVA
jgi:hypothetical protein